MEKIQSMGIGRDCITMVFGDGEKEELKRCPFSACGLYHSTDLAVCPTTGKSIAEEKKLQSETKKRQEEKVERVRLAEAAREKYKKKRLSGWRNKWRDVVFFFGTFGFFALVYNVSLASGWSDGYSLICGLVVTFAWGWFWVNKVNKYMNCMKAQASEIYERVLAGAEETDVLADFARRGLKS